MPTTEPSSQPSTQPTTAPTIQPSPPAAQFETFAPTTDEPWDAARAGHLLRRLTFGPTLNRLDTFLKLSSADAIHSLLDFDAAKDPFAAMAEQLEGLVDVKEIGASQQWWIYRMLYSPNPVQEKVALFWHNRFATSATKVGNGQYMQNQIDLFRKRGLGSFRDLLIAVARDPAMLIWLDGRDSKRGKPNENFGREVMELFTLGIGNYSENDVKQLSRAFTGWRIEEDRAVFHRERFDEGMKTVFGVSGRYDAEQAVDLILKQPAAPKFLATKLLREFVHPSPTDEQISHYAERLLVAEWNIKAVLREIVSSRMFFSTWAYRAKIKSPGELVIGAAIAVGGKPNMQFLRDEMTKMGQNLLFPPNVKGWDGGAAWINANTVLVRFNFGMSLATAQNPGGAAPMARPEELPVPMDSPEQVVDFYARLLLDGKISGDARKSLLNYLNFDQKTGDQPVWADTDSAKKKVRDTMYLMMSMPEYQLA